MAKREQRKPRIAEQRAAYRVSQQPKARQRTRKDMTSDEEWNRVEWEWVRRNRKKLEEQYSGQWIAVANREVVGTGKRLHTALKQARARGANHPFVEVFKSARVRDAVEVAQWL